MPAALAGTPTARPPTLDRARELTGEVVRYVRRGVKTLRALPDREHVWQQVRSSMPEPPRDWLSYDSDGARAGVERAMRFDPTPADVQRCLTVWGWLAWLKAQPYGDRDLKIIIARTYRVPTWALADRFECSERTIQRWEGAAYAAIVGRFWAEIEAFEATRQIATHVTTQRTPLPD